MSGFQKVLVLALCFYVGACAFKKEDTEDKKRQELADDVAKKLQDDQKNSVVELKESTVSATFTEQEMGFYTFKLQWPDSIGSVEVYLDNEFQTKVTGKNYFTKTIGQGEQVSFRIRAYASVSNGGTFIGDYENIVVAPTDLLFYQNVSLTKELRNLNVNRIYFRTDTRLITNGYDVNIKAHTLIVDDVKGTQTSDPSQYSQIVTYQNSDPSKTNWSSRISITADQAIGKLQIAMIGKDGNAGKNGEDFAKGQGIALPSLRALDGTKGADGKINPGRNCFGRMNKDTCDPVGPSCNTQPTSGTNGADGVDGYAGQDGENGGDAGFVKIEVTEDSEFFLEIYQRPGKGGQGGKGTPGQLGGKGGLAGKRPSECNPASNGTDGKDGAPGADGKNGNDGRAIILETKVKNQRVI